MSFLRSSALSLILLAALAASASAQTPAPPPPGYPQSPPPGYPPPPPPGAPVYYGNPPPPGAYPYPQAVVGVQPGHQTHDGFYLALQLGPGYSAMSASAGGTEISVRGGGFGFSLALGGAVAPNLILFGQLIADSSVNPEVNVTGFGSATADGSATVSGVGGGVAFYIMPANVYLAGSVLATRLSLSDQNGDDVGESDVGFGANFSVGKEWWVSDNWGLGLGAQLMIARMKDKEQIPSGSTPVWTSVGFAIAFSATFN
jgi:hypothetical protein